jgi:hypothetical protein
MPFTLTSLFTIHAVDVRYLEPAGEGIHHLRAALASHTLAVGRLEGSYERAR